MHCTIIEKRKQTFGRSIRTFLTVFARKFDNSFNFLFFTPIVLLSVIGLSAEEVAAAASAAAAAARNAIASPSKSDKKEKAQPPSSATKPNPAEDAASASASSSAAASASLDLTAWIVWALRAEHQRVPMLKALMMHHVHQLLPLMLDAIYASYVNFPEAPLCRVDAVVPGSQGVASSSGSDGASSGSASGAASSASGAGSAGSGTRLWPAVWAAVTRPVDRRHAADLYLHVILAQARLWGSYRCKGSISHK
jgi:hypothetical protein